MVRFENISFCYDNLSENGVTKALDDISFYIEEGEYVGLIGSTGSGKTTLCNIIAGLLAPTSGTYTFCGENDPKIKSLKGRVGLVFQYPEHQLFEETIYKDIAFGPTNLGVPKEQMDQRVLESLELVGLPPEILDKSPFDLSGGQKRRVAIAGVLAMRPRLLMLDEPTAGLDPVGRDELFAHLRNMHEQLGITIIVISHSMEDMANHTKRLIVLNQGRICMQGDVQQVFARADELVSIGLDVPQISLVIERLRRQGIPLDSGIYTPDHAAAAILNL